MELIDKTYKFQEFSLRLTSKDHLWCQVFLRKNILPDEYYLGGDSIDIIKKNLAGKLQNAEKLPRKVEINNHMVCWVITLLDGHASIFFSPHSPISLFIVFDELGIENPVEIQTTRRDLDNFIQFILNLDARS